MPSPLQANDAPPLAAADAGASGLALLSSVAAAGLVSAAAFVPAAAVTRGVRAPALPRAAADGGGDAAAVSAVAPDVPGAYVLCATVIFAF